ncbi:MAG: rod shape-determining protein MreC [Paludibacteraceae bacterium]|nr:rod shape-determining protein MreC [Paludibacteraceae bacterium]
MRKILDFIIQHIVTIVFIFLEVIGFVLFFNKNDFQQTKLSKTCLTVSAKCNEVNSDIESYFFLREKNDLLMMENAELHAQLDALNVVFDSLRCDSVVNSWNDHYADYVPAKVVYKSLVHIDNYIVINVGTDDGVYPDMCVVADGKFVGMVSSASKHYAKVLILINNQLAVSAKLKKDNQLGRISWDGEFSDRVVLDQLPSHVRPKVGDSVITSGFSQTFPENVLIGKVNKRRIKNVDGFNEVYVNISIDYGNLEYVSVVRYEGKKEIEVLQDSVAK